MNLQAVRSLEENFADIERLLELHAQEGGDLPGRRFGVEVLNKSAIVLITSFWEAFCEDLAQEALDYIVEHATSSGSLSHELKRTIAKRLKEDKNELAVWNLADDHWRKILKENVAQLRDERNLGFNNPKWQKVDDLFERAIGLANVSENWYWQKSSKGQSRKKLNDYVTLRGDIAHRGKAGQSILKNQVTSYVEFVRKLSENTSKAVSEHVTMMIERRS